ncbi:MAG: S8/S53 family peptidase, partial [Cyclobacteriaceae bacterium]
GFPNFFGTSASAPHAAALGALMIEAQGNYLVNSDNIEKIIEETAIDMEDPYRPGEDPGFDFGTGAGLVNSVAAVRESFATRVVQKIRLTSMCSSEPAVERRWRVRNPNPFDIAVNYSVYKSDSKGTVIAKANSDTFFFTEAVPNSPNTTIIKYLGSQGKMKQDVKASSGSFCPNQYSHSAARSVAILDENIDELDISSFDQEYLFALYPNPALDKINISFLVDWEETFDLKLIDGLGKICLQKKLHFNVNGFEHELNIAHLPKGVYVLSAQSESRSITQKFVKR